MLLFTKDVMQLWISSLNSKLQDITRTIQVMNWLFNFITWIPPQPLKYALRTNNIRTKFTTGTALDLLLPTHPWLQQRLAAMQLPRSTQLIQTSVTHSADCKLNSYDTNKLQTPHHTPFNQQFFRAQRTAIARSCRSCASIEPWPLVVWYITLKLLHAIYTMNFFHS